MMEAIFNQSGAELRIQDGGTHKSVTIAWFQTVKD